MTYQYGTAPVERPDKAESASLNQVYVRLLCYRHGEHAEGEVALALLAVLAA